MTQSRIICCQGASDVITQPNWYKWILLASTCLSQLLSNGYMAGASTVYPIHYEDRFGDRKMAGQIGVVGLSISFLACLPAHYLNLRIGERWLQIIGGVLMTAGEIMSGLATAGWMALLGTGIFSGVGVALISIATFSILGKYFEGKQLVPVAANVLFFNIGAMVFPLIIGTAILTLGYVWCKLVCAALVSLLIICGLLYLPNSPQGEVDSSQQDMKGPRFSLRPSGTKKGVFNVSMASYQLEEADSDNTKIKPDVDKSHTKEKRRLTKRQSSLDLLIRHIHGVDEEKINTAAEKMKEEEIHPAKPFRDYLSNTHGASIAELVDDQEISMNVLFMLLKKPKVSDILDILDYITGLFNSLYVISTFLLAAGMVGFNSLVADYSRYKLHMSDQTISQAMSAQGFTMLISAFGYLTLTLMCSFSSSMLHVGSSLVSAVIWMILLVPGISEVQYIILVASYGVTRSLYISNLFPTCLELCSRQHVMGLFMLQNVLEGLGGLSSPYLALYLQVEVNLSMGIITIFVIQLIAVIAFLPVAILQFGERKQYEATPDNIITTKVASSQESL